MARTRDEDSCPGALQLHRGADGPLARVRLPGGRVTAEQLGALARTAARFGSPAMELTSRGSLQIRAITDTQGVADAVAAAGLLPSATHERVRNIVASPLSGRAGPHADVTEWIGDLDTAICADGSLAALPGRFWFGVDDGRADVSGLGADTGVHVLGERAALLLAGRDSGVRLTRAQAVPTLVGIAARFVRCRGNAWRVAELADADMLLDGLAVSARPGGRWPAVTRPPVGWIVQDDGRVALGAVVPLGVLSAQVAECLAALGAPMVITPWRSVLVCDLQEDVADAALRVLAPLGLVFDENSPWCTVSACTGRPGCAHASADVRAAAAAALVPDGGRRHYVGCERACGSPPAGEVYLVTGSGHAEVFRRRSA